MAVRHCFLSVFIVFATVSIGTGLRCYSCVSSPLFRNYDCEFGVTHNLRPYECDPHMEYCVLSRIPTPPSSLFPAGETVTRKCSTTGPPSASQTAQMVYGEEWHYCWGDLCNSGVRCCSITFFTVVCSLIAYLNL